MLTFPVIFVFFCYFYSISAENFSIWSRSKRAPATGWGYTAHNGPQTWGGVCQSGKKQSPINIQLGSVIVKDFPPFRFSEDYLTQQKFFAKNNGHTIYVALKNDSIQPVIYGGGLGDKFIFEQLHMHWESEHEFEGKRADLEMHLVHYNAKYGSFAEASTQPDGLAVLAVLYNKSNHTDSLIESFFDYILDASALGGHSFHIDIPENSIQATENNENMIQIFALRDLLPRDVWKFFRYEGSLTTPGCGEVVQWTVFISRFPVSSRVLEALRTLRDHDGIVLNQNFRPPQDLNERKVYIQIQNYDEPSNEFNQVTQSGYHISPKYVYVISCCLLIKFYDFNNCC